MAWYLVISCLLIGQLSLVENTKPKNPNNPDVYHVFDIDSYHLRTIPFRGDQRSVVQKLNDFLIKSTDSTDAEENLDIILKEYQADKKNKVSDKDHMFQGKGLLLALRTLTGENGCNNYSYKVLSKCVSAIQPSQRAIVRNENARRIDKVLAHYINRHLRDCPETYFRKFDQFYSSLNKSVIDRVNRFTEKAVSALTSDEDPKNKDKSVAQRLFRAANDGLFSRRHINPEYVYGAMLDAVRGTPDERYMRPVANERTGYPSLIREKFDQIYLDVVGVPCSTFRNQLGPDVFQPLDFDGYYGHQIQEDKVTIYDAMLRYQLCHFDHPDGMMKRVAEYASFQE